MDWDQGRSRRTVAGRASQELFTDLADRFRAINVRTFRLFRVFQPGIKIIGNMRSRSLVGGMFTLDGSMTVGVLAAFLLYLRQFFRAIRHLAVLQDRSSQRFGGSK